MNCPKDFFFTSFVMGTVGHVLSKTGVPVLATPLRVDRGKKKTWF